MASAAASSTSADSVLDSATCTIEVRPGKRSSKSPAQADPSARPDEKKKGRAKYTQRACDGCRQRKVKCCGKSPCWRCAIKNATCTYACDPGPACAPANRLQRSAAMTEHRHEKAAATVTQQDEHASLLQSSETELQESKQPKRRRSSGGGQSSSQGGQVDNLPRPQLSYQHLYQSPQDPDEATDTFEINNCGQGNMSLRSKFSVLHNTLAIDLPTPVSLSSPTNQSYPSQSALPEVALLSLELPDPPKMMNLLQVYFEEHNPFFPCVDQAEFESRLLQWISNEGYGANSRTIAIPASQTSLAALLCIVFAVAEFIDPRRAVVEGDADPAAQAPGHAWHQQGLSILREVRQIRTYYLDVICFHTLEAMYLIDIERLGGAEKAVALGISLAIRGGLNNEKSWTGCTESERMSRRMLWWSLYYIDRRVAEKSGQPYCMRDIEVDVDDFSTLSAFDQFVPNSPEALSLRHLQGCISWSRLWGQAWDTFFALKAPKLGDQIEVQAMDARVEAMRQDLPSALTWDTGLFESYIEAGEDQRMIRSRLLTMTRINLLRMILHHNPLVDCSNDMNALQICGSIAIGTIKGIVTYMDRFHCVGQLGHMSTATLVECICHLIPSLATSLPQAHREAAATAINHARQLLLRLSTHRGAAKRAQKVLEHVFDAVSRLPVGQGLDVVPNEGIAGAVISRARTPYIPTEAGQLSTTIQDTTLTATTMTAFPPDLLEYRNQTSSTLNDASGTSRKRKADEIVEFDPTAYPSTGMTIPFMECEEADFSNDWLLNSSWMDLSWLSECDKYEGLS